MIGVRIDLSLIIIDNFQTTNHHCANRKTFDFIGYMREENSDDFSLLKDGQFFFK